MKMRSEAEMTDIILTAANTDCRIRAAYMNGSRANPKAPKDIYRDYDIVFVVTETATFLQDRSWLLPFGVPAIVQEPDSPRFGWGEGKNSEQKYTWLILFDDGNRIDLSIYTVEKMLLEYSSDSLTVPLLDKDGILPKIPPASDVGYCVSAPKLPAYLGCCNEFWWCLNNVAKGIARDELPYAMEMFNVNMRAMLIKMLEWQIGAENGFEVSPGKLGKYFKKHLSSNDYELYTKTFSDGRYENLWIAVLTACKLFHSAAQIVGKTLNFAYCQGDEDGAMAYFLAVKNNELC